MTWEAHGKVKSISPGSIELLGSIFDIKTNKSQIPIRVFSNVKPSTFHILTVWSEDAVARYLENVMAADIS